MNIEMLPQPDETTCGPSCLYAVYRYFGDNISLSQVIAEVQELKGGGTLAVFLASHALRRGYSAKIYTYNLNVFDPTWFIPGKYDIKERLIAQKEAKNISKLHSDTQGYLEFLSLGGELRFEDLTTALIRKYLNRSIPIITGLSSTYLYRTPREYGHEGKWDDIKGEASGHFVVLCGYDREKRRVLIADPLKPNPVSEDHSYEVSIDRVLCSILLGILTYDANFLIISPSKRRKDYALSSTNRS
ncbi:MAG: C39 family peptidase [Nitrospirota bacterium]